MVTPLKITFPKTRDYLWDSSSTGDTMDIFAISNNRLKLEIRIATLKLAVQHCRESGATSCFLLGSAQCNSEEELVLSVDRFDPGVPTHSMDIGPTAVLEGDIPVRTSICAEEEDWQEVLPYSERELEDAIETLALLISQNQQVSLDMFLTLSLSIRPLPSSPGLYRLRAVSLLSGAHLLMHSIPPIPVLPTALARNLTGPSPIYEVQQRARGGYLTMDESRRLLLLLDSDPKAPNFPIVGVWVGGPSSVRHPSVWASCMQYVCTEVLGDRAAVPARGFLLMLYSGGTAAPAFFQCSCQQLELPYSFLSAETSFSRSQEETLACDLVSSSQPVTPDSLRLDLLSRHQKTLSFQQKPVPYTAHLSLSREDSLLNLSLIESVASRTGSAADKISFCQQVTSSMLISDPVPPPVLPLSPLQTPTHVLSAEQTTELLREQQLKINALQVQIEMLLQHQSSISPPPASSRPDSLLQLTRCSTLASVDPSLPSLHPNDLPSFLSMDSSHSSALREIEPRLLALSPPQPDRTDTFSQDPESHSSCDSSRAPGAQEPIRLFSSEFIRQNETHREQTARQQTPSLHSESLLSEPHIPKFHTSPISELSLPKHNTSPLLETAGLSSIYIPRIQYRAAVGEDSFLSVRDPSDQLALKYLEGRSILLDPSVQQLSFIKGGQQLRTGGSGLNGISAVSVDTRSYLERHNLAGDK